MTRLPLGRRSDAVTIKLDDNASGYWTTNRDYRDVVDKEVATGQSTPDRCPATQGRVEVCNAAYGETG